MMKTHFTFLLLFISSAVIFGGEQIRFKYIDGAVCIRSVIEKDNEALNVNLIFDFGSDHGLVLHKDALELLEFEQDQLLSVDLDGWELKGINPIFSEMEHVDEFSKQNAAELGEVPVWGLVGSGILDVPVIMLDIQNQILECGNFEIPDGHKLNVKIINNQKFCEIEPEPGYSIQAIITTGQYECVFDVDTAALAGNESGDFNNCKFAGLNLRDYTAVRTENDLSSKLVNADCLIANSFWQNFVVYLDAAYNLITLVDHPNGIISDLTEQEYYNAYTKEDSCAIKKYLNKYPNSRLADKALHTLLGMAVESGNKDKIEKAINRLIAGKQPKQAAEALILYAQEVIENKNMQLAELFLKYAKVQVLKTEDAPILRSRIDSYQGWIALENQQLPRARRHLLSALFVNPQDPFTNYVMGRYHELNKEYMRAWARYLKASLAEEPHDKAINRLKALNKNAAFKSQFSINDVCDFLEGHITDDQGELTKQAIILKARGGDLIKSAIEQLQR